MRRISCSSPPRRNSLLKKYFRYHLSPSFFLLTGQNLLCNNCLTSLFPSPSTRNYELPPSYSMNPPPLPLKQRSVVPINLPSPPTLALLPSCLCTSEETPGEALLFFPLSFRVNRYDPPSPLSLSSASNQAFISVLRCAAVAIHPSSPSSPCLLGKDS